MACIYILISGTRCSLKILLTGVFFQKKLPIVMIQWGFLLVLNLWISFKNVKPLYLLIREVKQLLMLKAFGRRSKLMMILLSLLTCCLLLFRPLNVFAASQHGGGRSRGEPVSDDDALYYTIGSLFFAAGVTLVDPDAYATNLPLFKSYYNSLDSGDYRSELDSIFEHNKEGYSTVYDATYDFWYNFETTFIEWLNDYDSNLSSMDLYYDVTPSASGLVGFTSDSFFTFDIDSTYNENVLLNVDLGKSWLNFGILDYDTVHGMYPDINFSNFSQVFARIENPDNFSWVGGQRFNGASGSWSYINSGNYTARYPGVVGCYGEVHGPKWSHYVLFQNNAFSNAGRSGFVDGNGNTYQISSYGSGYAFVDVNDSARIYNNLTFPSNSAAWLWFADSCGLKIKVGDQTSDGVDYTTHQVVNPLVYDVDDVNDQIQFVADLISSSDDNSKKMILVGNQDDFNVMNENSSFMFNPDDFTLIPIYPSDIPKFNTNYDLWKRKFPFCLFYDVYNFIGSFSAHPSDPVFDFMVVPDGFCGMTFDDLTHPDDPGIYISFNFDDYSVFIGILRFFLGAGYVIFLIFITRKLLSS